MGLKGTGLNATELLLRRSEVVILTQALNDFIKKERAAIRRLQGKSAISLYNSRTRSAIDTHAGNSIAAKTILDRLWDGLERM